MKHCYKAKDTKCRQNVLAFVKKKKNGHHLSANIQTAGNIVKLANTERKDDDYKETTYNSILTFPRLKLLI